MGRISCTGIAGAVLVILKNPGAATLQTEIARITYSMGLASTSTTPQRSGDVIQLMTFTPTSKMIRAQLVLQRRDNFLAHQFYRPHGVLMGQGAALGFQQQRADSKFFLDVAQLLDNRVRAAHYQVVVVL